MGVNRFLIAALLSGAPVLFGQAPPEKAAVQADDGLIWVKNAIENDAVTHYFDPPSRKSDTKWQVVTLEGCTAELRQTWHLESPDAEVNHDGIFAKTEDKTVTYSFDLHELRSEEIQADTSIGLAQVAIFAHGDLFHMTTDTVTRTLAADGSVKKTVNWSTPGHTGNLWIYFDSPEADNKAVARRVAVELQMAADKCSPPPVTKRKRSPKSIIAAALR